MLWASSSSSNSLLSTATTLLSSSKFPSTPSNTTTISDGRLWIVGGATAATCLMLVEGTFALLFYKVLVPRLQQLRPPAEYRGYARDRRRLLNRILQRFEATCRGTNTPVLPFIEAYIRQWFHPIPISPESTIIQNRSRDSAAPHQAQWSGTSQRTNSFVMEHHNEGEEKKDNDDEDDGSRRDRQQQQQGQCFQEGLYPNLDPKKPEFFMRCLAFCQHGGTISARPAYRPNGPQRTASLR